METAKKVGRYFADCVPESGIVPVDFCQDASLDWEDDSAAAIAACGMLEMIKNLSPEDGAVYQTYAKQMLKSVFDNYAVKDSSKSNGLVLHSTYSNHSPYNTCNHYGVDECNSWGDYFYMEALTRLHKDWELYW